MLAHFKVRLGLNHSESGWQLLARPARRCPIAPPAISWHTRRGSSGPMSDIPERGPSTHEPQVHHALLLGLIGSILGWRPQGDQWLCRRGDLVSQGRNNGDVGWSLAEETSAAAGSVLGSIPPGSAPCRIFRTIQTSATSIIEAYVTVPGGVAGEAADGGLCAS
jgi:hypothetical protein